MTTRLAWVWLRLSSMRLNTDSPATRPHSRTRLIPSEICRLSASGRQITRSKVPPRLT